jgi:hypothetical protein
MRRLSLLAALIVLAATGAGLVAGGTDAQSDQAASPTTGNEGIGSRAVGAEECRVEPRSSEEVLALLGLGAEPGGTPAVGADRTPVPAPPWPAAGGEVVEAATATIREWLACINADDNLRIAALMTDAAIVRFFGGTLDPDEAIEGARTNLAGTPTPRAEGQHVRLEVVSDVSQLDDGRVAALVLINEPALPPHGQETLLVILAEGDGRWLIDDIVQFSVAPAQAGTPQP